MAFKFPFTNYHELNLTWVLEQLKKLFEESEENVETIETYDNRLSAVESEVSTLETTTSQAINTANAAATNASTALSRANTANQNALTASSQAGAAVTAAQESQQEAQTATQTAQQAQATAMTFDGRITQAQNDASAAVHEAESFENRVNAAINTANNAANTATIAQGIAVNANQAAAQALDAAQEAAESVEESATQIAQNTQDISDVKNVTSISKIPLSNSGYIGTDFQIGENAEYGYSDYIQFDKDCAFQIIGFDNGSASFAYSFYTIDKIGISGQGNITGDVNSADVTIPNNTAFVRFCTWIAHVPNAAVYVNNTNLAINDATETLEQIRDFSATPDNSSFFVRGNYFDTSKATVYTTKYPGTDGRINGDNDVTSIRYPVKPNTRYAIDIPGANRCTIVESDNDTFDVGSFKTVIAPNGTTYPASFTTGNSGYFILIYVFSSKNYDWESNKDNIVLNIGDYTGDTDKSPYIDERYIKPTTLQDTNVLIFGDSITDCCTLTINSDKETTSYAWDNPSNSYTDAGGNTILYSMWPKILKLSQPCKEIRNYALSGATYQSETRTTGEERKNLQYQIDVALNDIDNPNNVFVVDNFVPDIVVFALGTNDNSPNDTYMSAMAKTVYQSGSTAIDVAATLANLDDAKTFESARKAFIRIKQAFPMALIFCVLPIQEAGTDNFNTTHDNLKQMAERYGCIVIDGAAKCGITMDFNNASALGLYLKDGLHPNEKGQNLLARLIISTLISYYIPFGSGFNT